MTAVSNSAVTSGDAAGVVFVGGFSYADVMDSAKGWAGTIRCNTRLSDAFQAFYNRCSHLSIQTL